MQQCLPAAHWSQQTLLDQLHALAAEDPDSLPVKAPPRQQCPAALLRRQLSVQSASGRCGPGAAKARRGAHGLAAVRFLAGCWKFMWGA
ncbi:MAG: hypothetical protein CR217_18225 [Beijerinckiaceae bacterium]|nr:MAG: hypothetical protein CR217_18225 [Beijerinckiaceae bacterium]